MINDVFPRADFIDWRPGLPNGDVPRSRADFIGTARHNIELALFGDKNIVAFEAPIRDHDRDPAAALGL